MASPPKQLLPCLCGILLLSIVFFSHAKAQRCKIPDSDQDRLRINYNMEDVSSGLYAIDNETVLSTIGQGIRLWHICPDGLEVDEASFSVAIFYQQLSNQSGLAFLLLPLWGDDASLLIKQLADKDLATATLKFSDSTYGSDPVSGSTVSVRTGVLASIWNHGSSIMIVDITIYPPAPAVPSDYAVWIEYARVGGILSVYVEVKGKPKPDNAIAEVHLNIYSVASSYVRFGLLCAAEQFSNVNVDRLHWNATIDDLSYNYIDNTHNRDIRKVTVLCSVLGSILATAVMAMTMALYLNSRHRQWRKDLDQLARSIERLPGVPTKIDFADIKKATGNFHEAMKLGGGGFGTVYRCTLPIAASKTERPMDVAVKRFTRDVNVQERRYDDFLAEVSIINRLRHKNIVPLVGWSYNKGEPLLVFEFMTNGSLDQHLFPKCGRGTGKQREGHTGATIRQWATRYDIVKDIATGLHYVHHEYEPMVLHRDIKASNVMLDSSFRARLGDFGLACTVTIDRNSATGVAGTWGYIAPDYALCGKATRHTDIYALGVLILEVVTGQRALIHRAVDDDDVHITDRVWRLHREGRLLECIDSMLISTYSQDDEQLGVEDDIERLLLLGLACSNPNPSDRPAMPEVMQVIAKSVPPPEVPLMKPSFVWPPPEGVASEQDYSTGTSMTSNLGRSMAGTDEPQSQVSLGQPAAYVRTAGGHASFQLEHSIYVTAASALGSGEMRSAT